MVDVSQTKRNPKWNVAWGTKEQLKHFLKITFCVHNLIKEPVGEKHIFKNKQI